MAWGLAVMTNLLMQYVDLSGHQEALQQWYLDLCSRLGLVGRVRVARDGVNVTVSRYMQCLELELQALHHEWPISCGKRLADSAC